MGKATLMTGVTTISKALLMSLRNDLGGLLYDERIAAMPKSTTSHIYLPAEKILQKSTELMLRGTKKLQVSMQRVLHRRHIKCNLAEYKTIWPGAKNQLP